MKKATQIFMIIVAVAISTVYTANAQVSINTDGSNPDASAMLEVKSSDKGFLPPRMTAEQMNALSPVDGLTVYNTDVQALCVYNSSKWDCMDVQSIFDKIFYCGDNLRDFRDGKSYSTVQIGTQCWMSENLNIGTRIDGGNAQTDNNTIEKYCYGDDPTNCDIYGGLYQWDEAMGYVTTVGTQGICPTGWHLPSDDEFKTMEIYLGMTTAQANNTGWRGTNEGSKLAGNSSLWHAGNLTLDGDFGSSGFTALPGGYKKIDGTFFNITYNAIFWLSSMGSTGVWSRHLYFNNSDIYRYDNDKTRGYSVRCIKD